MVTIIASTIAHISTAFGTGAADQMAWNGSAADWLKEVGVVVRLSGRRARKSPRIGTIPNHNPSVLNPCDYVDRDGVRPLPQAQNNFLLGRRWLLKILPVVGVGILALGLVVAFPSLAHPESAKSAQDRHGGANGDLAICLRKTMSEGAFLGKAGAEQILRASVSAQKPTAETITAATAVGLITTGIVSFSAIAAGAGPCINDIIA